MPKTFTNFAGLTPEAVQGNIREVLVPVAVTFSFRKLEEVSLQDTVVNFGFTTKTRVKITGKITVTKQDCVLEYAGKPSRKATTGLILSSLESGITLILSHLE